MYHTQKRILSVIYHTLIRFSIFMTTQYLMTYWVVKELVTKINLLKSFNYYILGSPHYYEIVSRIRDRGFCDNQFLLGR